MMSTEQKETSAMYDDSFAIAELPLEQEPVIILLQRRAGDQHAPFLYDQYNWSEEHFVLPYRVLRLTQGYFAIISKTGARAERAMRMKWHALVLRDEDGRILKVYAVTTHPRKRGGKIYLHRFLKRARPHERVDHKNGMTLDNQDKNLKPTSATGNMINAESTGRRTKHKGLPRGVEKLRNGKFKGKIQCGGSHHRSKGTWETPERAQRWYRLAHQVLYRQRSVCESHVKDDYPIFPPKIGEEDTFIPF